ncbi:hypothetical protein RUM43_000319 [Polyplax serrata]|uniref:Tr-type G domain-containing protein n=1 Tax=Polyplax serrata TaxID=468196 RepID=A0AAN8SD76_POLSC
MRVADLAKLLELQKKAECVRNICILAHVDHGKTTIADSLVASNGIISAKLAGKLRYMDSRKDEQERGITMKSSAITLLHSFDNHLYLINLIDSPGHVDFSSEVSTAVRLCDGAIVVVDVVEGVCAQTKVALQQAWLENIKPILVLNKIDRFILELKLSPLDTYYKLMQVLEQVNAVMGELFATDVMLKADEKTNSSGKENNSKIEGDTYDWSSGLEEADDENLYFSPEQENVIFASAFDGWAFEVKDFAKMYHEKLGIHEGVLKKTLWGDYYLNTKSKRILKGAQVKAKKPLFVQLILENIWALYDVIALRRDKDKLEKIVENLGIKLTTRDLKHTDCKVQLQAVCSQWLPLARTVLDVVCRKLPAPNNITIEKSERLMSSGGEGFENLPLETQKLRDAFVACDSSENAPTIVFISKMFPVETKNLPQNKQRPLTTEELAQRREMARKRHEAKLAGLTLENDHEVVEHEIPEEIEKEDHAFIAFARVFSGTLKEGQELFVLGPKHDPSLVLNKLDPSSIGLETTLKDLKSGQHITRVKIQNLYLLMGRDLESVKESPAGNIIGIGNLEEHVLKTATLSNSIACPSFSELKKVVVPILRVAVEPINPGDLPQLIKGLKLLNQADAAVQVLVQETGEHVIVTDGEVHLQRCLDDLKERYAKIPINVSEPIVPFRETIVPPPIVDMVNQAIEGQNTSQTKEEVNTTIVLTTPNKQCQITLRAAPLPNEVTAFLENNTELIRMTDKFCANRNNHKGSLEEPADSQNNENPESHKPGRSEKTLQKIESFKSELKKLFSEAGQEWEKVFDKIWCFGPRRCGPNILFNLVDNYDRSLWSSSTETIPVYSEYDSSFSNGFQLAALAGPLCEEPMMGVAFFVEKWEILNEPPTSGVVYGPLSGQIMSCVKDGCRKAFQAQPQRIMAAMYSCNIQANAEVLGK